MGPLQLGADPHAAAAEDAAVGIEAEQGVGGIHRAQGVLVGKAAVVHAHGHRQRLQFAGAAGNAVGANVVALGEQQLHRHAPPLAQVGRVGGHHLALQGFAGAGGLELALAFDLNQAQSASAHGRQAIEVTQHRQRQPRRPGGGQQA